MNQIKRKIDLSIFSNLPSGGGNRVEKVTNRLLSEKYNISSYKPKKKKFSNFLDYYFYCLFQLPKIHHTIAKKINNSDSKIVIAHHDYLTKAPYILSYLNKPSIYICHEEPREFYGDKKFLSTSIKYKLINMLRYPFKFIDKKNASQSTTLVANSYFSKSKLKKIYKKSVSVIYPGVDTSTFYPLNIKKEKQFLTVGSTSIFKGIDFIIEAISNLPKKYQYKLIIIGNYGRDWDYIKRYAKIKNVEIEVLNNINDKKINEEYNKSQLLLAAARNEPFGLSLVESLTTGTKVVCTNEGGYPEIISNKEYGICTKRNVQDYTNAIINCLQSKTQSKKMVKQISKEYSWSNFINELDKIITSLT